MVPVPDVTGLDEADAFNALLDADLTPGERTDAFDADIPEDRSSARDESANTDVERGGTVDYVVSRGPEATPTPEPKRQGTDRRADSLPRCSFPMSPGWTKRMRSTNCWTLI